MLLRVTGIRIALRRHHYDPGFLVQEARVRIPGRAYLPAQLRVREMTSLPNPTDDPQLTEALEEIVIRVFYKGATEGLRFPEVARLDSSSATGYIAAIRAAYQPYLDRYAGEKMLELIGEDEKGLPITDIYRAAYELRDYCRDREVRDILRAELRTQAAALIQGGQHGK